MSARRLVVDRVTRVCIAFVLAFVVAFFVVWAGAAQARVKGIVVDEVDAFSPAQERALEQRLTQMSTDLDVQFAVVFISRPEGTIADHAHRWHTSHNMGVGENRDGVMLTVAVDARETNTYLNGTPYRMIDRDYVVRATDIARPYFANGDWAGGVDEYLTALEPGVRQAMETTTIFGVTLGELGVGGAAGTAVGGALMVGGEAMDRRRMKNVGIERQAAQYVVTGSAVLYRDERTLIDEDVQIIDLSDDDDRSHSSSSWSGGGSWTSHSSSSGSYSSRF